MACMMHINTIKVNVNNVNVNIYINQEHPMEEIKEKSAKKPVSMRLTATASERLMHIIDLYKNLEDPKGEQQESYSAHS